MRNFKRISQDIAKINLGPKSKKSISSLPEISEIKENSENKMENKQSKRIKEIIFESATGSTTHSIPHIFKRENLFIKLFWIACFMVSTGFCAWLITIAIINYFNYETVTKTETVLEIPTTFPTISICNLNPYITNYSIEFVENILTKNKLYEQLLQVFIFLTNNPNNLLILIILNSILQLY